jgi:hypothetical protein
MTTQTPPPPVDGQQLLSHVASFFQRYLVCTEDQLTVLTLWTLHTHCFAAAPVTPYLHIRSRERESGKTICLELLRLLCMNPWLTCGCTPAVLLLKLEQQERCTVLLDDCDSVLARSRSVVTLGLLNRGFSRGGVYNISEAAPGGTMVGAVDAFCPKAFAGMHPLPPSIDGLCVPINIEPKELGAPVERFNLEEARQTGEPLRESLHQWTVENAGRLAATTLYREDQLPQELSPRQQDCAEPLLQLADIIGGGWPLRLSRALVNVYTVNDKEEEDFVRELLLDLRDAFASRGDPPFIPTGYTLAYLHERGQSF